VAARREVADDDLVVVVVHGGLPDRQRRRDRRDLDRHPPRAASGEPAVSLEKFHAFVSARLTEIATHLPPGYRLTLLARHETDADAHIVVTRDDLDEVIVAIGRLQQV
jgi:hypothetical protein